MKLRPAEITDIPSMKQLADRTAGAPKWSDHAYSDLFPQSARMTYVVEVDRKLVGWAAARASGDDWELENIVVDENVRRSGIGSALLNTIVRAGRDAKAHRMHLEVRASNWPARSLYVKAGFEEFGVRPKYYDSPQEDAVLYALVLLH